MSRSTIIPLYLSILWALLYTTACSALSIQKILSPSPHSSHKSPDFLPVIIWHGLGDSFDAPGLLSVGTLLNATNPNTPVYNIRLAPDSSGDRKATFFGSVNEQISTVCADLAAHPVLSRAPALNALGFSQGGQFLRAYIERCNNPPVASLVTFGSQHNGISEFQLCTPNDWVCHGWESLLKHSTWSSFVQSRLVPAQYFRDPADMDSYLAYSDFLADINNERPVKKATYAYNMRNLTRFAMYVFAEDKTVVPKESAWFADVNTTSGYVTPLQDRLLYLEDWIGLRWLDEQGRLDFKAMPGAHMELTDEVLVDAFRRYFRPVNAARNGG